MKWYEKPSEILFVENNFDYIMCVDENGNSDLTHILKKILCSQEISVDDRYFTITGCIFSKDEYNKTKNKINMLKEKYWKNGMHLDQKTNLEKRICLHSRDIRKHEHCFNENIINYEEFIADLTNIMKCLNCKIISISIDLYKYLNNVAFDFLLERYIYATKNNRKGILMLEARGKEEDKNLVILIMFILLEHINKVINKTGTKRITVNELKSKIKGVYFNPKWNSTYSDTYVGLEIADLFSYPIYKYIKRNVKDKAFITYEEKIEGYPNYKNKGIKLFPEEKVKN